MITVQELTSAVVAAAKPAKPVAAKPSPTIAKRTGKSLAPAPQPAKPAPAKAPARAKAAPVAAAPVLALGKPFSPKAGGLHTQALNWEVVLAALPATAEVLIEAIKAAGGTNARGFVTGRIRDGHIKAS
jgi:hypothetical protein